MKTLKTALFAAVVFATLVGALVLSELQLQESEGQSIGPRGRPTAKQCCYYERANKQQYVICTIDPQCPQITGNLIGSWGVEDCIDCKNPSGGTTPIGHN